MDYVLKMPLKRSIELVKKARYEERREIIYRLWLVRYPNYTQNNYETFDEFYEKSYPPKIEYDMRSKDELMGEILGK